MVQSPKSVPPRQLVLVNGLIYPTPRRDLAVPALAIADGRIIHAGDPDRALSLLPDAPVVDLAGRTVLPAFVDSHTHFHRAAVLRALFLDFEALRPASIAEAVEHVRTRARSLPAGAWIQGDSISAAQLAERRLPDRRDLDAVAPHHPVLIRGIGKHVVAANSAALEAAGIDRETPDPPGGRIERDEHGEPTGVLHERAKLRLDASAADTVVPKPTAAERAAALRDGLTRMHQLGIGTIHEMVRQPEESADWAALHARGELRLRIRLYYRVHESPISLDWLTALGIRSGWGDEWLSVGGVKISVDGWCIFGNAAVYEPYLDEPDNRGLMRIDPGDLTRLVETADRAGLRVAVHAVGARAVDAALDAFDAAAPWQSGPHRLEHAHLDVDAARLRRIATLGLTLSAQPGFLEAYLADWRLGLAPDRIERIMPLASAQAAGIPTIINSDVPSGPLGPLGTIRAAVERGVEGRHIGIEERLDRETAWCAHSTNAADATADPTIGRLEAGRGADLIVFEDDPLSGTELPTSVGATMVGGEAVHDPHGWLRQQ